MTARCDRCQRPALEVVRFTAPAHAALLRPAPLCSDCLGAVMRLEGISLELLTGVERLARLREVRPMAVGGLVIEDMAPGEVQEAFGK